MTDYYTRRCKDSKAMHFEKIFNMIVCRDHFCVFLDTKMLYYNISIPLHVFFPKIFRPQNMDVFKPNFVSKKLYQEQVLPPPSPKWSLETILRLMTTPVVQYVLNDTCYYVPGPFLSMKSNKFCLTQHFTPYHKLNLFYLYLQLGLASYVASNIKITKSHATLGGGAAAVSPNVTWGRGV